MYLLFFEVLAFPHVVARLVKLSGQPRGFVLCGLQGSILQIQESIGCSVAKAVIKRKLYTAHPSAAANSGPTAVAASHVELETAHLGQLGSQRWLEAGGTVQTAARLKVIHLAQLVTGSEAGNFDDPFQRAFRRLLSARAHLSLALH